VDLEGFSSVERLTASASEPSLDIFAFSDKLKNSDISAAFKPQREYIDALAPATLTV
jgi:hypothetical protein